MRTTYPALERTNILGLDDAMYIASCFAGNAEDKCVTILMTVRTEHSEAYEIYRIEDGRVGKFRDNETRTDWQPVYVIERAEDS